MMATEATAPPQWTISEIDTGYCRIIYANEKGARVCFQDEGANHGGVQGYTITDYDEPCDPITLKPAAYHWFELPTGDSELETAVRQFLEEGRK